VIPSRSSALARFLEVASNAVIGHLSDPWCFTVGDATYFVLTQEEARSTCAHGIETLLPKGVPAADLARYVRSMPLAAALTWVERLQRRRDKDSAAEDLLDALDEKWATDLIERDGLEFWLEKTLKMAYVGRWQSFSVFKSL
jgi:hypothetical protein